MSSPQPAEAVVGLYNELLHLQPSDRVAIGRIVWQLRKLRRVMPTDVVTVMALAQSLTLQGQPSEACALAAELWSRRHLMRAEVQYSYGNLLMWLGKFDQAVELARAVRKDNPHAFDKDWRILATNSAFAAGDMANVRHFGAFDVDNKQRDAETDRLLAGVDAAGILPHIAWHQGIVNAVLADRITRFGFVLTTPDGSPEIGLCYFTPGTRAERRTLIAMIDDAIERETEARGLPVGLFVPTLVVNVLDHDAQPPYLH